MTIRKTAGRAAFVPAGDCTPIFDHIAVWSADTEASARFLTEVMGWKRNPTVIHVSDEEKTIGGMIGTFFDSPGLWFELIEPTTPGPGQDILDDLGDGALVEINFDLGNEYGLTLEKLAARGVEMVSMNGSPLIDGNGADDNTLWLRLVQPAPGGRAAKILEARGRGHIMEMGVVVDDLAGFCNRIANHGITLVDDRGDDFAVGKEGRRSYFRSSDSCGIPIRIMEWR